MKAIIKRAFEPVGRIIDIDNTLKALQGAVGGHIEPVQLTGDMVILVDEAGFLKRRSYNCTICGVNLFGTLLVVGVDGEEFCDIPEELTLEKWEKIFLS